MLSTSVREAHSSAVKLATQAEAERLRQQEEEVRRHPPADSATQIRQIALVHEQQDRARTRLEDERRMLSDQLAQATARLEANAEQLREQRASMQKGITDDSQRKSDEQFLQAVRQLEQIPPKQAKKVLETLMAGESGKNGTGTGVDGAGLEQAVSYLDAMSPRAAAKVLREFKTDGDIMLATELLERLRTHGVNAPSSKGAAPLGSSIAEEDLPHAGSAAHPDDPDAGAH
jgi:hypothetical protein